MKYFSGEQETDRPFLYYIKGRDYSVAIDAGQFKEHVEQRVSDGADVVFVNECIQKVYADLSLIKIKTADITVKDIKELDFRKHCFYLEGFAFGRNIYWKTKKEYCFLI